MKPGPKRTPIADRFWQKVEKTKTCWNWTASLDRKGYGKIGVGRESTLAAHRVSYELANGPIPEGKYVCHTCDNPACVKPDHLFLGTHLDNMKDMIKKDRHCRGQMARHAKLTNNDVLAIRSIQGVSNTEIAKQFNITDSNVSYIRKRKTWKHI